MGKTLLGYHSSSLFIHLVRRAFIAAALLSLLNRESATFGRRMNNVLDQIVVCM